MFGKLSLAAAGAALAVLGLVGTGVDGAFTSAVTVQDQITAGVFHLSASGTTAGDAGMSDGSSLAYDVANAVPGERYPYEFTVTDTGTLPGEIDAVGYVPSGADVPPAGSTVEVDERNGGEWQVLGGPVAAGATHSFPVPAGTLLIAPSTGPTSGGATSIAFRLVFTVGGASPDSKDSASPAGAGGTVTITGQSS